MTDMQENSMTIARRTLNSFVDFLICIIPFF